ncbi:hypothetical protein J6590_034553 [Homalodisca vitripennis]|nr:hypothetical protein J6590_034553 [Homalodisca vitripennis]
MRHSWRGLVLKHFHILSSSGFITLLPEFPKTFIKAVPVSFASSREGPMWDDRRTYETGLAARVLEDLGSTAEPYTVECVMRISCDQVVLLESYLMAVTKNEQIRFARKQRIYVN